MLDPALDELNFVQLKQDEATATEKVFTGHNEQTDDPAIDENVPAAQPVQTMEMSTLDCK